MNIPIFRSLLLSCSFVILFPAIDLKDGKRVRLVQGDMARATVFHDDPAAQAAAFQSQGFEYLHIVDLDGAIAGKPVNTAAVEASSGAVETPIQLAGGSRDSAALEACLGHFIDPVIIRTPSVRNPEFVRHAT